MRKVMFLPLVCVSVCALALAGCSSAEDIARDVGVDQTAASQPESAEGVSIPQSVAIDNDAMIFDYQWSDEAHDEPKLRGLLDTWRKTAFDQLSDDVEQAQADAKEGDYPYRPHSLGIAWQTVANLPRFLSLATDITTYTGGAHGNLGHDALIWDRDAGRSFSPVAMFRSPTSLGNAAAGRFCAELDRQRMARRGAVSDEGIFGDCPPISELTVILLSSDNTRFDAVQLVAAPYVAGPYAEGTYEVTVPVDPQILDAVAPEFSGAFGLPG